MGLKIAIVTTTVREPRKSLFIAKWVLDNVGEKANKDNLYEIVDLQNYNLPMMGTAKGKSEVEIVDNWKKDMAKFDAYIFVVAEYNRAPTGVFKNALDYLMPELNNKVVSYVGYGGLGASRAIEHLRLINAEQQMATIRGTVNLLLTSDFNGDSVISKPHLIAALNNMNNQLTPWAKALKAVREEQ